MSIHTLYIGTYTQKLGHVKGQVADGIYLCRLDSQTGALSEMRIAAPIDNPSYLVLHPSRRFLYAVNETPDNDSVSAFEINPQSCALRMLNRQPALGGAPCFLAVDATGRFLYLSNYVGGNVVVFPILPDGRLNAASHNVAHSGYGPDPSRQAISHAHSISLAGRFALACDLGLDKVIVYRLDLDCGKIHPHSETILPAGTGPRHLDFHPNGQFVYVIGELGGLMIPCRWDAGAGQLSPIDTVSTLPPGFTGEKSSADVHVHPSGQYLYGSNRVHHSIVIYRIDESSGRLTLIGHESVRGQTPRNFCFDPSGQYLLAANQDSGNIVTFRINPLTGLLSFIADTPLSAPVCLRFLQ